MPIEIINVDSAKYQELLERGEGHFLDFKSKSVSPAKLDISKNLALLAGS